jgi:hypothetical protein
MGNVPGINGNTYSLEVCLDKECYVKVADAVITENRSEVRVFLMAYKMGRDHKKTEIRNALNI